MKNKSSASLSLRRLFLSALVAAPLATLPVPLWALPADQAALNGLITTTSGVTVTLSKATQIDVTATNLNSVIKWTDFGGTSNVIGAGDTVKYDLPTGGALLNWVVDANAEGSLINGTLDADGSLWILNTNGVTIGATGVINVANLGISTVADTDPEFTFLTTGSLARTGAATQDVIVTSGAKITAASGSGNVWINAQDVDLAGTIAAGNVNVVAISGGNVRLGQGGDLTVGNATVGGAALSVNSAGTIAVANNVTVNGPTVSLTTGNNTISNTGTLTIGTGNANSTLTANSGTAAQTLGTVTGVGTGTLTVNSTASALTIGGSAKKLAVGGTVAGLTNVTGATDITVNNLKTGSLTLNSTGGSILSGGTIDTTGAISVTATAGKDIAIHTKAAAPITIVNAVKYGSVTLAQDSGDIAVPTLTAGNVTVSAGNITLAGVQTIDNNASYTAVDAVTLGQNVTATNLTARGGMDVAVSGAVNSVGTDGTVSITSTGGAVNLTGIIGATTAPKTVTVSANKAATLGANISTQPAGTITVTAGTDLTQTGALATGAGNVILAATAGNVALQGAITGDNVSVTAGKNIESTAAGTINASGASGAVTLTAGSTGNVILAGVIGGTVAPKNVTVTAGKRVELNANVSTAAGNLNASAGTDLVAGGALVAGTGNISLSAAAGNVGIGGAVSGAKVVVTASENVTSGAGGTINGNAGSGNVTLTATNGNVSLLGVIGGTQTPLNVTATAGKLISLANVSAASGGRITANAGTDLTTAALSVGTGNVILTAANDITIGGAVTADTVTATAGDDLTTTAAGSINDATASTGVYTLKGTAGNVTLGAVVDGKTVAVTAGKKLDINANLTASTSATLSAAGNVTIADGIAVTAPTINVTGLQINSGTGTIAAATKATLQATEKIDVDGNFTDIVVKGASAGATITDTAGGIRVVDGTNTTGDLTISGANIVLGASSSDAITVGGQMILTSTAGTITDTTNNTSVTGNVVLSATGGGIVLDGNAGNGVGLNSRYGQVQITATGGDVVLMESSTLNLGNISAATRDVKAYSATSIVNNGALKAATVKVGAGTGTAPGSIKLDSATNEITGAVTVLTDLQLMGSTSVGNYLASELSITNKVDNAAILTLPATIYGGTAAFPVTITAVGDGIDVGVGALNMTGLLTLKSGTGSITAIDDGNTFTNVAVTSNGVVDVRTAGDLTVAGTMGGGASTVAFTAGTGTTGGDLMISNYSSSNTGMTTFKADAGKSVTDAVAGISIYGDVTFDGNTVAITKTGHNFGGVNVTTRDNGSAVVTEAGTLRLATVNTGTGSFSGISSLGDIRQSGALTAGNVSLSAANGMVKADNAGNAISGWVSLTAKNDSVVVDTTDVVLGTTTVSSGGLTINAAADKNITQATGSTVYTYGKTQFTTTGTGNITVANAGNQFGNVTLTAGTGTVSIAERTTLNLSSVDVDGTFTATSNTAIIDTGALILTVAPATFTAPTITLDNAGNDFGTVSFTSTGDVLVVDKNDIILGASAITNMLDVTAAGFARQAASITVGGNTTFTTGTTLTLDATGNQFGAFRFSTGGATIINEATTFNLRAGSLSTAPVSITTGGDFMTSGTGGSSFTGGSYPTVPGLTINAAGNIDPGPGSLLVTQGLKVKAGGTADLFDLSLSGNLSGKAPIVDPANGGYVAPSP